MTLQKSWTNFLQYQHKINLSFIAHPFVKWHHNNETPLKNSLYLVKIIIDITWILNFPPFVMYASVNLINVLISRINSRKLPKLPRSGIVLFTEIRINMASQIVGQLGAAQPIGSDGFCILGSAINHSWFREEWHSVLLGDLCLSLVAENKKNVTAVSC